jgi:hypothetical protein
LGPIPNPQSPIPQSRINLPYRLFVNLYTILKNLFMVKILIIN